MMNFKFSILDDVEQDYVWKKIYQDFNFKPTIDKSVRAFKFSIPVKIFELPKFEFFEDNEYFNETMKDIFSKCMGQDDYMYALEWNSTCFRYNPNSDLIDTKKFIKDLERCGDWGFYYPEGDYNIFFPEFYPDGDYYFFIAKDFRWGYLSHPWQWKVWVYGEQLINEINNNMDLLNFHELIQQPKYIKILLKVWCYITNSK